MLLVDIHRAAQPALVKSSQGKEHRVTVQWCDLKIAACQSAFGQALNEHHTVSGGGGGGGECQLETRGGESAWSRSECPQTVAVLAQHCICFERLALCQSKI
jgi:hypothetical protein